MLGGILQPDDLQEDQVWLVVYLDIPAAATTDVCVEEGCGTALHIKPCVTEQNPIPLNQAVLVSRV